MTISSNVSGIALLGLFIAKSDRRSEGVGVYEVWEDVREDHPGLTNLKKTHCYRLTKQLVSSGLLEVTRVGRKKKGDATLYGATTKGRNEYQQMVRDAIRSLSGVRAGGTLWNLADLLSSLQVVSPPGIDAIVKERIEWLRAERGRLEERARPPLNREVDAWVRSTARAVIELEIVFIEGLRHVLRSPGAGQ